MSSELSARAHYQILGFIKGTTYFSGTDDDELSQRLRMLRLDGSVQNVSWHWNFNRISQSDFHAIMGACTF